MIHHERILRNFFRSAVHMWVDDLINCYGDDRIGEEKRKAINDRVLRRIEDELHHVVLEEIERQRQDGEPPEPAEPADSVDSQDAGKQATPSRRRRCEVIPLNEAPGRKSR